MVRYTYNRQVDPPAPFVHVTLRRPMEGGPEAVMPGQIDSAADLSAIPARLVEELGLVPLDSVAALGFGGHLMTLPTYLIEFQIRDLTAMTVKVLASPDEPYVLIGRDVLNHFTILLDGPGLAIEIREAS